MKDASAGVLQDLKRFQKDKEGDLRRYMVSRDDCKIWLGETLILRYFL